jgi:hypothetical protein
MPAVIETARKAIKNSLEWEGNRAVPFSQPFFLELFFIQIKNMPSYNPLALLFNLHIYMTDRYTSGSRFISILGIKKITT